MKICHRSFNIEGSADWNDEFANMEVLVVWISEDKKFIHIIEKVGRGTRGK